MGGMEVVSTQLCFFSKFIKTPNKACYSVVARRELIECLVNIIFAMIFRQDYEPLIRLVATRDKNYGFHQM